MKVMGGGETEKMGLMAVGIGFPLGDSVVEYYLKMGYIHSCCGTFV